MSPYNPFSQEFIFSFMLLAAALSRTACSAALASPAEKKKCSHLLHVAQNRQESHPVQTKFQFKQTVTLCIPRRATPQLEGLFRQFHVTGEAARTF